MGPFDFTDLDPGGLGFNLDNIDVLIGLDGADVPMFRGAVLSDEVSLPERFPWRFHSLRSTDYQREIFDRRVIGAPGGDIWSGPDSDGNFIPVDGIGTIGLGESDKGAIQTLFTGVTAHATVPGGVIDADTFVNEYAILDGAPYTPDRAKVRQVMEWIAGQASGNVQYWLDPALRLHYAALPRWYEQESDIGSLLTLFPETAIPLERAPVNINNTSPDGVTTVGCRNLGWNFQYGGTLYQFYVVGGVGFKYNGGLVDKAGTGWICYGQDALPTTAQAQEVIDVPSSVDMRSKRAAAIRAQKATDLGVLRGHMTVGNERHHPDGFHVGQLINIYDERMPDHLRGRDYVIQRVATTLIPNNEIRVYEIEWGDAPTARTSSRQPKPESVEDLRGPGRLFDVSGRHQNPLAGSTVTVVGQLVDEAGNARRVYGVAVDIELHVWDASGNEVTDVGSLSAYTVTTDQMGAWQTDMTVDLAPGYSYCVCPVGSNACTIAVP